MSRRLRAKIARRIIPPLTAASILFGWGPALAKETGKKAGALQLTPDAMLSEQESGWLTDLDEALERARKERKPILICVTATWCPACRAFDLTLLQENVEDALARWICVEIDLDRHEEQAEELGVTGVPALRLRTPSGRPAGSHNGALPADELVPWLEEHYEEARSAVEDVLMESGRPLRIEILKLIALFDRRDPTVRQAALRRLLPYPEAARQAVVEALRDGNLATRLMTLELLGAWDAPTEGIDPWDPETMTESRLDSLDDWAADAAPEAGKPSEPSEAELAAAVAELDRMLQATDIEAEAIAARLARFGEHLLPAVAERMQSAPGDRERMLLRALRYRLVASDALALSWAGGFRRLASPESDRRRRAAEELANRATGKDQALLLELFSDPDPLVREISLRGLQNIGGPESVAALTKLLSDPEPNVRAAVLKQLEENPHPSMLPAVTTYLSEESDPDLVVHGIRFLRALDAEKAVRGMMSLLEHPSWQVRAEAAAGLSHSDAVPSFFGNFHGSGRSNRQDLSVDVSVALLKLLEDPEPFVVAKALEGLESVDMEAAVDYLVAAVEEHPSLAERIIEILARGEKMRAKALPHLITFCKDEEPSIRAAAVAGLAESGAPAAGRRLLAGLEDPDARVRTAAANALFDLFDEVRQERVNELSQGRMSRSFSRVTVGGIEINSTMEGNPAMLDSMLEKIKEALGGKERSTESAEDDSADEEEKKEDAEQESDDEIAGIVWETWLERFFAGKNRPKWSDEAVEPLTGLLDAEDVQERAAAARALVPLGRFDRSLPVFLEAVKAGPAEFQAACRALPWLPWQRRREAYAALRPHADDAGGLQTLIHAACDAPDRRIASLLWEELAEGSLDETLVRVIQQGLTSAYSGKAYYWSDEPLPPAALRDFNEAAEEMLVSGSLRQRLVALGLCTTFAPPSGRQAAREFLDDRQAAEELQSAAAKFLLLTLPKTEAVELGIDLLDDPRDAVREASVAGLADAKDELNDFGLGSRAKTAHVTTVFGSGDAKPIVPLPPKGLRTDDVLPLYEKEKDEKIRAYAAYLLALLGDDRGLDGLIRYWRENENSGPMTRLVYRAIAALNDASRTPILEEIYDDLESYEAQDFYWTIRIMGGREVLLLRKRIRDEVGTSVLR